MTRRLERPAGVIANIKAANFAAVAAIIAGIVSLVTLSLVWGLWALTCAVLAGVFNDSPRS